MTENPKPLVDDLADVLARMVVGWEDRLGVDLAQHPDVQRVMARYRAERDDPTRLDPDEWADEDPAATATERMRRSGHELEALILDHQLAAMFTSLQALKDALADQGLIKP